MQHKQLLCPPLISVHGQQEHTTEWKYNQFINECKSFPVRTIATRDQVGLRTKKKKKSYTLALAADELLQHSRNLKKTSPGLLHLHKRLFRECVLCRPCAAVPIKSPSVCPDTTPIRPASQSDPPQILKIGLQPKAKPSVQKGCTAEPHFRMRH